MNADEPTTYVVRPAWQAWGLLCLGIGVVGIFVGWLAVPALLLRVTGYSVQDLGDLVLLLMLGPPLLSLVLLRHGLHILGIYLEVTSKGLVYHSDGRYIRATWHSLACYGPVNWGGLWPAEGVRLRRHGGTEGIPLDIFAANWPLSPLGQSIQHYQPHLTAQPVQPAPVRRPAITRRLRPLRAQPLRGFCSGSKPAPVRLRDRDTDTVRF
jgi:hypothetical protein